MTNLTGINEHQRISFKRKHPNPLFKEWLEELHNDAKANNSKLEPMLREALTSISKYPLPLQSGAECAILKGFEKKLCLFIDKRLEVYKFNKNGHEIQPTTSNSTKEASAPSKTNGETSLGNEQSKLASSAISPILVQLIDNNSPEPCSSLQGSPSSNLKSTPRPTNKSKKKSDDNIYKPTYRSGGYAILITLLENMQNNPNKVELCKEDLIERAQKYSEESFVRPKLGTFYTAWSNMTRLVTKGLVQKTKSKKLEYSLTDQGVVVAKELLKMSAERPTTNDIIFNDGVASCSNSNSVAIGSAESSSSPSHITASQSSGSDDVIEFAEGSYDVVLLIDKNETSGVSKKNDPTVAEFNKYRDLKHEYRSLKVGDYTWIAKHKENVDQELVLPYVVERKRMDDLGASIKDGRYYEQKFRLRKCGLDNIIYMVENYGKNKHVGLPVQSLMQGLANTRIHDEFKVHVTDSLKNSARFLAIMTKRLMVEYKDKNIKGSNKHPSNGELMTFQYFNNASSKTKPSTITGTFIKLLLQLKGLTVEKALGITYIYKTPATLIEAYKECSQKEAEMLLTNVKFGISDSNIGPAISKSIYILFNTNSFKNVFK